MTIEGRGVYEALGSIVWSECVRGWILRPHPCPGGGGRTRVGAWPLSALFKAGALPAYPLLPLASSLLEALASSTFLSLTPS